MITRQQVTKALREIAQGADFFDQTTKGQCRKLDRLMGEVALAEFSLEQFQISLQKARFTDGFVTDIVNILSR